MTSNQRIGIVSIAVLSVMKDNPNLLKNLQQIKLNSMTDKEIVERAKDAEKRTGFGELVHSPISKGINSAYGIGFIEGMVEYRNSLQEEPVSKDFEMALAEMVDKAQKCVVEPWVVAAQWKDELTKLAKSEEPASIWHDASEEPNDLSHCLIYFGSADEVSYLDFALVFYNKKEKSFITGSYPHPTGYKVEQKSLDGGCVAEVYKNRRDRISISDITQWCYLYDLHNLSNIEKTEKCGKEEPVSEALEKAAREHSNNLDNIRGSIGEMVRNAYKAGAKWKKEQIMVKTVETTFNVSLPSGLYDKLCIKGCKDGDKLLVIKKDEL